MMNRENDIQLANPTVWVHARKQSAKQSGASIVEYVLLLVLIALIAIPAVTRLGGSVKNKYLEASDAVAGAGNFPSVCPPSNPDC